ncbi:hypothetical protein IQ22_04225 [Pseudomonas duriflava]|uniref:Uncharacterized protein n=1 Tax=Pseudomonas duriflava TaxID=459528 RepID=A0A562PUA5_9PSED|nr:hypothetical protein [Pseudomonas duriflava]TWI48032.1 hypothetical protein IQ22_04225 [Pseudomonas duriflava]
MFVDYTAIQARMNDQIMLDTLKDEFFAQGGTVDVIERPQISRSPSIRDSFKLPGSPRTSRREEINAAREKLAAEQAELIRKSKPKPEPKPRKPSAVSVKRQSLEQLKTGTLAMQAKAKARRAALAEKAKPLLHLHIAAVARELGITAEYMSDIGKEHGLKFAKRY